MLIRGRGQNLCATVPELSLGKLATMTLDSVGDSQLSFSADTESESNSSSTCCTSSSSTKTVSLLDRLLINIHNYFNGSCMRKFQKENNYYKNNRGSFWELENRIMGRKKRIMCGCLPPGPERTPIL